MYPSGGQVSNSLLRIQAKHQHMSVSMGHDPEKIAFVNHFSLMASFHIPDLTPPLVFFTLCY